MSETDLTASWYKDAIIYQLHIRAYSDSNGDGSGDLAGLVQRLDYIRDVGVTAIWLLPFYPSPLRDDGYDIADYKRIHPAYGNLRDFRQLLREAHRRELKVITELVLNHTSDQHKWFQRSRRAAPGSRWRNFYVWSDDPTRYSEARIIFRDFENSNWEWDPVAKAYYWHRFYKHQPDLNFDNPDVQRAVLKVLDFWMEMGVDAFRLDAVPYLFERDGTTGENLVETHAFLKAVRKHVDEKYPNRMLLAEANQWPEDAAAYFGDGDECHMNFHFPLMPRLFMALQREDRFPIVDILDQTPEIPENCQWGLFLRNHDELTLEMVTDDERDYMYRSYAEDPRARINLGIRRRLAPLLGNNRRKIELLNGLLFSLPGTPIIYYGDELGMGDNVYLGDRDSVRTPMQWSPDRNAGFSRANPQRLYLPVVVDPEFHFSAVNVEAQDGNPQSLLWWMRRIIALRKRNRVFGRGSITFLFPDNPKVLAFLRSYEDETVLVVANLSRFSQYLELDLGEFRGMVPVEMFGRTHFPPIGELPYLLTLGPHSFYWFMLTPQTSRIRAVSEAQLPRVRIDKDWTRVFRGRPRATLEAALAEFLRRRESRERDVQTATIQDAIPLTDAAGQPSVVLTVLRAAYTSGDPEVLAIPLGFASGESAERQLQDCPETALMRVTLTADETSGFLYDATAEAGCSQQCLDLIVRQRTVRGGQLRLAGARTREYRRMKKTESTRAAGLPSTNPQTGVAEATVRVLPGGVRRSAEDREDGCLGGRNFTDVIFGERLALRLFRRIDPEGNPDVELSRFLRNRAGFEHTPRLAGVLGVIGNGSEMGTVAVLREHVPNEGTAWDYVLDELGRYLERVLAPGGEQEIPHEPPQTEPLLEMAESRLSQESAELIGPSLQAAELIGRRTAEMHRALACDRNDPQFAPEPFSSFYQRGLYQSVRTSVRQAMAQLRANMENLGESAAAAALELIGQEKSILDSLGAIKSRRIYGLRIRCHTSYRLDKLLYTGKDFVIADFSRDRDQFTGERLKRSPLLDLASMIHSFHQALYVVLAHEFADVAGHGGKEAVLTKWGAYWHAISSAAMLRTYLDVLSEDELLPSDRDQLQLLLNVCLTERSFQSIQEHLSDRGAHLLGALRFALELAGTQAAGALGKR